MYLNTFYNVLIKVPGSLQFYTVDDDSIVSCTFALHGTFIINKCTSIQITVLLMVFIHLNESEVTFPMLAVF